MQHSYLSHRDHFHLPFHHSVVNIILGKDQVSNGTSCHERLATAIRTTTRTTDVKSRNDVDDLRTANVTMDRVKAWHEPRPGERCRAAQGLGECDSPLLPRA